jgi:hypothetical protein
MRKRGRMTPHRLLVTICNISNPVAKGCANMSAKRSRVGVLNGVRGI